MDISRLKKVLAGISVAAIALTQVGTVLAYSDVPAGVWYESAVKAFSDAGYLDTTQANFRPMANANRAEFVKLLVELNGGVLSTPPAVASFTDVSKAAWYYGYFEDAAKEGWVRGDNNCYGSMPCYARPSSNVNRAEAAALIVRAFSLESKGLAPAFVDVATGQWYTDSVMTAADHCVLQGDDSTGRVRPSDSMNRAEMVVMLHRVDQNMTYGVDCGQNNPNTPAVKSATAVSTTMVDVDFTTMIAQTSAEMASNYKITAGTQTMTISSAKLVGDKTVEITVSGSFDASTTYTVMVSNVKTSDGKMVNDSASFKGFSSIPVGNGTLEVSVSSKNPSGDTVPKGANGVTLLSLDLTASCTDSVALSDVTIVHGSLGQISDITGVYASMDGARVSRKRTIDSKAQTATLHFTKPVNVAACKTVTLDLMADFNTAADTGGEHSLEVELPSDVMSNAKEVKGTFPLKGKTFKLSSVTSGTVTVTARAVSPTSIKVGDTEALIGKYEIRANSIEDQTLYSLTFQQNGSSKDGDVTNIKVARADGTVLTNTVASAIGDYATVIFNPPLVVKSSDSLTLSILGDVIGGANQTVEEDIEETSDVFVVGSLYGYGVNGQLYGSQVVLANPLGTPVTIDAGQFTISINGPAQQTYTRDQDQANLANIDMSAGGNESIDVRHMYMTVQGNTSTGAAFNQGYNVAHTKAISQVIENVVLKDTTTGRSYTGVRLTGTTGTSADFGDTAGVGTYQIYRFDDFTVKGDSHFQFLVDFIDNGAGFPPDNANTFKISICGEPKQIASGVNVATCSFGSLVTASTAYQMQVEGLTTTDAVKDVRPRGTITGNAQRIASANLTVAVKAIGGTDVAVKNVKDVNLLRFEARAGEAKDILFTKASFVGGTSPTTSGSLLNGQNYTLWVDTDNDGKVDTILQKGVAPNGTTLTITFDKLTGGGFVIGKQKTVVFEVHADISSSLVANGGGSNWLMLAFDTANTYIEAQDVIRGSSLSGIKTNGTCATTCDITVTTTPSEAYSLVSQGDLYVINDTVPVRNRQLLGGTLGDPILRVQFSSRNEGVDVTDLQITASGSTASSVDRLELWLDGATSPFATATVGACGSDDVTSATGNFGNTNYQTFCAKMQAQELLVAKNTDVKVLVRPRMKDDLSGAIPGQLIQLFIDPTRASNNATGSGAVRARGRDSSNNLIANNGDSASNGEVFIGRSTATSTNAMVRGILHVSTLSKIAAIVNAHPSANGSPVPTGASDLGMFKISAAANSNSKNGLNKVTMSGVIFNVTANNITIDQTSFVLYNTANQTVSSACTARYSANGAALGANVASGSFLVDCGNLQNSSVNVTIDPGTDATFSLKGTVVNNKVVGANTSTLLVSIQNFDSIGRTTYAYNSSHFIWVDKDTSATTTAAFTWVEFPTTFVNSTNFQS